MAGYSPHNFCVPIPHAENMSALNTLLEDGCQKYLSHKVIGQLDTVGTLYQQNQAALYLLPIYPYDPTKRAEAKVSPLSMVRYDTNNYSVN